jgi:hypothetical protein
MKTKNAYMTLTILPGIAGTQMFPIITTFSAVSITTITTTTQETHHRLLTFLLIFLQRLKLIIYREKLYL